MSRRRFLIALVVAVLLLSGVLGRLLFSRPTFSPAAAARAETKMWQAYYAGRQPQLALQLVQLLRTQHGMSAIESKRVGEQFVGAALAFKSARGNYEEIVLPPLTRAYTMLKEATGLAFDPREVAQAELAWWVARRTGGRNSAEHVGAKIAELYATLYGEDHPAFREAGLLRARAARLRDAGGENADWEEIQAMLRQSYTALAEARK